MYSQFGDAMMGGQRMLGGGRLPFGGFGVIAALGFIIVAAVIVAVIIWAVARKPSTTSSVAPASVPTAMLAWDNALAIARDRLARGEIDPEQYTAIASALNAQLTVQAVTG